MGCQSSKSAAAGLHDSPTNIKPPVSPASPTLLKSSSVDLPSVEVQVIKQENSQRYVMAAPEHDRSPTVPTGRGVLEQLMEVTDQVRSQNAAAAAEGSPTLDTSEQEISSQKSESPAKRSVERSAGERADAANLSPTHPPPSRRVKSLLCDCCEEDNSSPTKRKRPKGGQPGSQLEHLMEELFRAHDLNSDGLLEEIELIKLNEAVAEVHDSTDSEEIHRKYTELFREKLDPDGRPVPFSKFRSYMLEMLDEIDRNEAAQEMMVEQFLAEARLARTIVTGDPLLVDRPRNGDCYQSCLRFCPAGESMTEVRA